MSLLTLIRTALKESWEQKTDRWGFKNESERKWNMKTGCGIFNKPLKEFCPGVQRSRITAGRGVGSEEVYVFAHVCVCI